MYIPIDIGSNSMCPLLVTQVLFVAYLLLLLIYIYNKLYTLNGIIDNLFAKIAVAHYSRNVLVNKKYVLPKTYTAYHKYYIKNCDTRWMDFTLFYLILAIILLLTFIYWKRVPSIHGELRSFKHIHPDKVSYTIRDT